MPFYKIAEMQQNPQTANPLQFAKTAVGEFMKAEIVTKPDEEGPPLHMHPNKEQFTLVLDGKLHFVLGDEERICERGDLIHIPRFTNHRSRVIGGPAVFFTVKSPAGDGDLDQDYNRAEGAEEAKALRGSEAKKPVSFPYGSSGFTVKLYSPQRPSPAKPQPKTKKHFFTTQVVE